MASKQQMIFLCCLLISMMVVSARTETDAARLKRHFMKIRAIVKGKHFVSCLTESYTPLSFTMSRNGGSTFAHHPQKFHLRFSYICATRSITIANL